MQTNKTIWIAVSLLCALHFFSGIATAQFAGGSGIEEDPYQIETLEQLQTISDSIHLDKHYVQIADIDASETIEWNNGLGFEPIGWYVHWENKGPFSGSYNGNGYSIIDLYINRPDEDEVGLFGYIENGTIQNIALIDNAVHGNRLIGGLAGYVRSGNVRGSYTTGITSGINNAIGGLIGGAYRSEIINSYATGATSGRNSVGGLVGQNGGKIDSSYATGAISGVEAIGGLIGYSDGPIRNSYATGTVSGGNYIGGLVGKNDDVIDNSYATGMVTGDNYTGGLVGKNAGGAVFKLFDTGDNTDSNRPAGAAGVSSYFPYGGQIDRSYATGPVSGGDYVGGLVGQNDEYGPSVKNSYATGAVSGINEVGGFIGQNKGNVTFSYTTSEVSGSDMTGGFIGNNVYEWITIHGAYWNTTETGQSEGVGEGESGDVNGLTTAQMSDTNAYINMYKLDYDEIWQLTESYPVPAWQQPENTVEQPNVPIVSVDPETWNYGIIEPGTSESKEFILSNKGNMATNGDVSLSGPDASQFEITKGEGSWLLEPDSSRIIEVVTHPSGRDSIRAFIIISHNAPNEDDPFEIELIAGKKKHSSTEVNEPVPVQFSLHQNYPNPFNPSTQIRFALPEASHVNLTVYNIIGQRVATLVNDSRTPGWHDVTFDGTGLSSGFYIYRLETAEYVESKQMIMVK